MIILYITLGCLAGWWVLWVLFLAVMMLKQVRDNGQLTGVAGKLGLSVLVIGYIVDFVVNMIPATILFLEVPFNLTVTARCSYYINKEGYRGNIARWLCRNLLDPFQIGGHCK